MALTRFARESPQNRSIESVVNRSIGFGESIGFLVNRSGFGGILGKLVDSLANRANAIRPYDILRRRSNLFLD